MIDERYHSYEIIRETESFKVYRARQKVDNSSVTVCVLTKKNLSKTDLTRFMKEYESIRSLHHEGVLPILDIVDQKKEILLVFEDWPGVPLASQFNVKRPGLHQWFALAMRITETLAYIHSRNAFHGNITRNSILVTPDYSRARLIEFGVDLLITGVRNAIYDTFYINEYLPYIAPEQTGRVNRSEDYRSDFYSLGVVLFELLTGETPFRSTDPLELIHGHIARTPDFPENGEIHVPRCIRAVLLKMMDKSPEERYQTAAGIKADLEACQKLIHDGKGDEPFETGTHDMPDRFIIPLKLYGREDEIAIILDTFSAVSRGDNRLLLVTGESGIGKSALIHEIHKPVLAHRGYFISGKYEQYKTDSPYSAIIQAFKELIHQLLAEKESTLSRWRDRFLKTLGPNGGVITDIFPELTLIVGKQPPPVEVGAEENKNRFNLCFESFVSLFTMDKRPLVLFLDDLQWVDFSSISLLTSLLFSLETRYLYVILSCRDNEVNDAHPFMEMLHDLKEQGLDYGSISLGPLSSAHTRALILDFLKCTPEKGYRLADQIFKKTAGNPFFVNQFLKTLYDKNIIRHDPDKGWLWEDQEIDRMQVTTNVLALMMNTISDLPEKTKEVMKVAACIGNRFDAELLSKVLEKNLYDIFRDLSVAISEGYLRHEGAQIKYHHDRILEASYALLTEDERVRYHLKIGSILFTQNRNTENMENTLFYITDQLNLGSDLIDTIGKRRPLFDLNMAAGRKAKDTGAFDPSLKYFFKAEKLLNKGMEISGDNLIALYREIADSACLLCQYDLMDAYIRKLQALSPPMEARVAIGEIQIKSYFARLDYKRSITISRQLLADLGVSFPEKVTKIHVARQLIKVKWKLRGLKKDMLLKLPQMTDPKQLAIAKIYYEVGISASLSDNILFAYMVLRRFDQLLTHGLPPYAGLFFLLLGAIFSVVSNDIKGCIRFADMARAIVDKPEYRISKHKVYSIYAAQVSLWNLSLTQAKALANEAYLLSREVGDQVYTGLSLMYRDFMAVLTTGNFSNLLERMKKRVKITEQSGQRPMILFHKMILQLLDHQVHEVVTGRLNGTFFNDDEVLPEWYETKNRVGLGFYYLIQIRNYYQFSNHEKARECLNELKKMSMEVRNLLAGPLSTYIECLNDMALYPTMSGKEKKKVLSSVRATLKKSRAWSEMEPGKHIPFMNFIKAELAGITGNHEGAPVFYAKAIEGFEAIPSPYLCTLPMVKACIYYHKRHLFREAGRYVNDTLLMMDESNAKMDAHYVRNRFADLLSKEAYTPSSHGVEKGEDHLDLSTIIKSAQALSGEIVLDKLMSTIMTLSLESAGAQRGLLILSQDNNLVAEMESRLEGNAVKTSAPSVPIEQRIDLPLSVVNYAVRTLTPVVLDNAAMEGTFTTDPYIVRNKIKSILAVPMVGSGKLKGIIYLENNLAPHVFSEERIRILDVLSSQAAISIENARLFDSVMKAESELRTINVELEDRVELRTRELKEAYEQIMGSIRYAGVIQHSLLPSSDDIRQVLPESVFIWEPRDIVGGDIYTCDRVDNGIIVSVMDCTGHSVPGAFMTMLAGSAIRRIIREEQLTEPALVLKRLNRIIKALLHQDKKGTLSDDGLDAGICFYNEGEKILYFAGAGIPLYIAGNHGLTVIKGDKQSIGYVSSDPDFDYSTHAIVIKDQSQSFYMATDGFPDQLGGDGNKRYGSRQFKSLLEESHDKSFDEQKTIFISAFESHKGANDQTDDVTLAGFRFV